jgi:hypothetical protein
LVVHAHVSPGGWTTEPLVAATLRRSLTPSTLWLSSTFPFEMASLYRPAFQNFSVINLG